MRRTIMMLAGVALSLSTVAHAGWGFRNPELNPMTNMSGESFASAYRRHHTQVQHFIGSMSSPPRSTGPLPGELGSSMSVFQSRDAAVRHTIETESRMSPEQKAMIRDGMNAGRNYHDIAGQLKTP